MKGFSTINYKDRSGSYLGFFAFTVCILLVAFSSECMEAAREGVNIWWNTLLPTLFPFFACATLMDKSGALHRLANFLYPVSKRFKLSNYTLPLLLLGGMTGYPSGPRLCGMLQDSGCISEKESERLSTVCNLASPMFLSGAVAAGMFGDTSLFVPVAIAHYGSGVIIAITLSIFAPVKPAKPKRIHISETEPLTGLLPKTLTNCMGDITKVGGSVIFFLVLAELFTQTGIIRVIGTPINLIFNSSGSSLSTGILLGIFEITGGCSAISKAGLPLSVSIPISAFIISFGGLSIMVQAMAFTKFKKPHKYILTKLLHGSVAAIIAYILMINRPGEVDVFSSGSERYVTNAISGLATLFACTLGVGSAFIFSLIVGAKKDHGTKRS